jgi:hypothetical protein
MVGSSDVVDDDLLSTIVIRIRLGDMDIRSFAGDSILVIDTAVFDLDDELQCCDDKGRPASVLLLLLVSSSNSSTYPVSILRRLLPLFCSCGLLLSSTL